MQAYNNLVDAIYLSVNTVDLSVSGLLRKEDL